MLSRQQNRKAGGDRRVCVLQGIPIRMELGPKDLAAESVVLVRRDTGAKTPVPWADVATAVPQLLKTIHVGVCACTPGCISTCRVEADAGCPHATP